MVVVAFGEIAQRGFELVPTWGALNQVSKIFGRNNFQRSELVVQLRLFGWFLLGLFTLADFWIGARFSRQ